MEEKTGLGRGVDYIKRGYLKRLMPARYWLLLPLLACGTPLHLLLATIGDKTADWRGQRLWIERGGHFTVLSAEEHAP
ncbi:MAG: hypothetical protein WCP31_04420 [Chloroflexales bacterium]